MVDKLLLCSCAGTQSPDPKAIGAATGLSCSRVHSALCGAEADAAARAMQHGDVIVACGQEAAFFEALAEEAGVAPPDCVDIRDRAGWSDDRGDKTPKIAALLALAAVPPHPEKTVDVISEGVCLILGASAIVLPVAEQLCETLSVTCVTSDPPDMTMAGLRRFDLHRGRLRQAGGSLGRFEVVFDDFSATVPAGRGMLALAAPRDGAVSCCDLILDLRGAPPLFPAHEKRDGYFRADPGDPLAVQRAAFEASHHVGTFEKPLHLYFQETLCAHSRAGQPACSRCLDVCPTGAITSAGDHVAVDPLICAGCGACAAVCPSGAVSYDTPAVGHVFNQLAGAARAWRRAGGRAARLLVHDPDHGAEMIALAARFGRGLPADVVPFASPALASFGHAEILAALGAGFAGADILIGPKADRAAIEAQVGLADALVRGLGVDGVRVRVIEPAEPDELSDLLFGATPGELDHEPILPIGGRREVVRLAARAIAGDERVVNLPAGAPYGTVVVDTNACTLCLACAGLCPPGALGDSPDKPQLTFQEDACLQCGLCVSVCPEDAITLQPRLTLSAQALSHRVLHEEEPYACIECGAPFGVRSTVERIVEKLSGVHPMYTLSDNARLIRMCDDCRVSAQFHADDAPFSAGPRPRVRTTDDYKGGDED